MTIFFKIKKVATWAGSRECATRRPAELSAASGRRMSRLGCGRASGWGGDGCATGGGVGRAGGAALVQRVGLIGRVGGGGDGSTGGCGDGHASGSGVGRAGEASGRLR